jgi:hypothetical protein
MSIYQFIVPDTWNGHRDIDEKLVPDDINKFAEEELEGGALVEGQKPADGKQSEAKDSKAVIGGEA